MTAELGEINRAHEATEPPVAQEPAAIVAHDLWYSFGDDTALEGISFSVGAGEIFGLVGPNGAGKTTTIRILATLLAPQRGSLKIHDYDAVLEPERARELIGYVPDRAALYAGLTLLEYLDFFARLRRPTLLPRIDAVLELTGLEAKRHQKIETSSPSERQRLGLARALLHDPAVLILDEPLTSSEPEARAELRALLAALGKLDKTLFLSSQSPSDLADLCGRVAIIGNGKLSTIGDYHEIVARLEPHTLVTDAEPSAREPTEKKS